MIMVGVGTDYNLLSQMPNLSPADRKIVERQLVLLPPKIKAAQEKEMGELIGGLKKVSFFFPENPNRLSSIYSSQLFIVR